MYVYRTIKMAIPPKFLLSTWEDLPEKMTLRNTLTRTATSTAGVVPVMNSPGSLYPASHAHKSVSLSYA